MVVTRYRGVVAFSRFILKIVKEKLLRLGRKSHY